MNFLINIYSSTTQKDHLYSTAIKNLFTWTNFMASIL